MITPVVNTQIRLSATPAQQSVTLQFEPNRIAQLLLEVDPILDAIWNYQNGVACYEASDEALREDEQIEKALIAKTYGPPMDILDNWDAPALTAKGAREALRFALEEGEISRCLEPRIENMIRAAYCFFKVEGGVA